MSRQGTVEEKIIKSNIMGKLRSRSVSLYRGVLKKQGGHFVVVATQGWKPNRSSLNWVS